MTHDTPNPDGPSALMFAWMGPFIGALIRPIGGMMSDKLGGARVTQWISVAMVASALGVAYFLQQAYASATPQDYFLPFMVLFLILFTATGIGNGSTFRTIAVVFDREQAGPVLGWTSAVAAYGAFIIPQVFGEQIKAATPEYALYGFAAFYGRVHRHQLVVLPAAQCLREEPLIDSACAGPAAARTGPPLRKEQDQMSNLLDRLNFLNPRRWSSSRTATASDPRKPRLGGYLPQPLAPRQGRALHPRGELHRLVQLEDLRQVRHRHVGDAADGLPAHAPRPAQPRTARLCPRGKLQLVSLFRQPGEEPAGARRN